MRIGLADSWFPDAIDIEFLGVTESFSDNDLTLKKRKVWDFCKIQSQPAIRLIASIEQPNRLFFEFWVF